MMSVKCLPGTGKATASDDSTNKDTNTNDSTTDGTGTDDGQTVTEKTI